MKRTLLSILGLMLALTAVQAQSPTLKVWAEDLTVNADGQTVTYLTVKMTDTKVYAGFQMSIDVPKGIKVAQKKAGRNMVDDIALNPYRFEGLDHSLVVSMHDDVMLKVSCMSNSADPDFYNDDAEGNIVEELFTIGFVADPLMENGTYPITFHDVKILDKNAQGGIYNMPSAVMTITGGQTPTSVNGITTSTSSDAVYDLSGRKLNAPTKHGVYIGNGKKIVK